MKNYNSDSIKSKGILNGVREKPASIGLEGHSHTYLEILANAIDEGRAGFGDEIFTTKNEDGSVTIRDFGRSIPMDKNSEGEYVYKKVFDELYASGKYDNNKEGESSYHFSLGTNGIGATGTNYTSDFFRAIAYAPNGKTYSIEYVNGIESKEGLKVIKSEPDSKVGTEITWKPSAVCFRGKSEIEDQFIIDTLKDQAIVNGGLKFKFTNANGEHSHYYYENGINDYIKTFASEEHALTDVISFSTLQKGRDNPSAEEDYTIKADIYFSFNRETSYNRYYHNSSWLEDGGTPEDFIKNSFTFVIDKFLKEQNLYDKKEKKISFEDIADSLIIITSTYSTISIFYGQSKKKIDSDFMKTAITKWLREQLEIFFVENPMEAKNVFAQVLINKRSREKAEKTRLDVKKKLQQKVGNINNRVDGFVNCSSNDNDETELYYVEGKSALGSTKQGRDRKIQAIYALRGKILNCLKADYDVIFKNEIILDMVRILGCGIEVKSKHSKDLNTFDINNLRWSKIIIATDADVDGYHIRTLILTVIYKLMPTLIEEGKVYIVESPLYEIERSNGSIFAYTDKEKDLLVADMKGDFTIQRSKGLGENTAEMMWDTTMNPETRRLIQVTPEGFDTTKEIFEMFLGDDIEGRKQYIEDNLEEYIEDALG